MNLFSKLTLSLLLLMAASTTKGQTIVLINGQATAVSLSGSDVVSIQGEAKGHMAGYSDAKDIFRKAELKPDGSQSPAKEDLVEVKKSEPIVTSKVTSKESIKSGQYIFFEKKSAELDKNAKKELRQRAFDVVAGIAKTILLEGTYDSSDIGQRDLAQARLENCKALLEKNGVGSNVIITNVRSGKITSNKISVTLR